MNATAAPNYATNGVTPPLPTAAELVKSLPTALKAELLVELIRERLAAEPDFPAFGVESGAGERVGVFLRLDTDAAAADEMYVSLPEIERLSLLKRHLDFDWNDCLTEEELQAISRGDWSPQPPTP